MKRPLAAVSAVAALTAVPLSGCIDVVSSTPDAVWVKRPMIAFGSIEGTAESECAKYGRRAVFQGVLEHRIEPRGGTAAAVTGARTVYIPIYAFNCE
jgi:hypothetical protein